jgi:hypothetical protein
MKKKPEGTIEDTLRYEAQSLAILAEIVNRKMHGMNAENPGDHTLSPVDMDAVRGWTENLAGGLAVFQDMLATQQALRKGD